MSWCSATPMPRVATGNVVFAQGNNRISAERAEFDTETRLGTFYNAWGIANVPAAASAAARRRRRPADAQPARKPNVYFFGETIEKIGPKKYKITNGGFSTCVQPTPRWDLNADTVILNIDHYTLLKQAVFSVKGVPMIYLPIFYYPTKRDNRATGFLLPTYGLHAPGPDAFQRLLLGRSIEARTPRSSTTGFRRWARACGSEYRYNFGDRRRQSQGLLARPARKHASRRATDKPFPSGDAQLRDSRQRQPGAAPQFPRAGAGRLLLQHRDDADVQHEHLRRLTQPALVRRQHRRRDGAPTR